MFSGGTSLEAYQLENRQEEKAMGALLPWRPFRDLERLSRNLEARFEQLFGEPAFQPTEEVVPRVESFVQDGNVVVRADLPGMDPKDVEVTVLGNVLMIKGERKEKKEVKKEDYIRREVSYGSFERRMTLPEGATADKIKAQFKNGVVEITIPVGKPLGAKKVPVEIEAKA
jgi:HSP20 family protein